MTSERCKKSRLPESKILILMAVIFLLGNGAAFADPLTIKFASYDGPRMYYKREAERRFLDEVVKQTNGKLRIELKYTTLLKSTDILDSVRSGKADLGYINIAFYPKRLILNSAIYLFQRGPTRYENIMQVFDRIYEELPALNNEIKQVNQKIVYSYANLPTAVYFNKPVNNFYDFKGKRIVCPSRWALEILKGIGAVPVSTSLGNLYKALRTNAIEGVLATYGLTHERKFEKITKYIIIARELWTPIPFHITINLDTWNSFSKEIQTAIESAAAAARKKMAEDYMRWFEWVLAEHQKIGCTIVFADEKDIDLWTHQLEARLILNQWKAEAKDLGYEDADILLEKIREIIHEGIEQDKL